MPFLFFLLTAAVDKLPAQQAMPPDKPKLICRQSGERRTGSHIRASRRCKTADEWVREDAELDKIPPTMRVTKGQEDGRPLEHSQ